MTEMLKTELAMVATTASMKIASSRSNLPCCWKHKTVLHTATTKARAVTAAIELYEASVKHSRVPHWEQPYHVSKFRDERPVPEIGARKAYKLH